MSKCDLTIIIDQGKNEFTIGEKISGRVQVEVDKNCKCDGLTVTNEWSTHGRGNRTSGGEQTESLFTGEWRAGESHSYPFEFTIQPGPITYHGHYLNIDHYLRARADIPWALDPKTEREFVVGLPDDPSKVNMDPHGDPEDAELDMSTKIQGVQQMSGACLPIFGLIFMLPGLVVATIGVGMVVSGDMEGWFMVPFGAIFVLVGGGIAYMGIRNTLAEKKLGPVLVRIEPRKVGPGQGIALGLEFTPQAQANINKITATLTGKESVVSGSGTNRTTHTHELHKEELVLHAGGQLFAGDAQELANKAMLPADAPFSFSAPDNSLVWSLEFHIDIAGWPDWSKSVPVLVRPV